WRQMGVAGGNDLEIEHLNVDAPAPGAANITSVVGDARALEGFADGEFEVVFSNSVIEHVGGWDDQRRMAHAVQRVGRRFFVQTPNRYFPLEPHFLFPGFQFLPLRARIELVRRFALGYHDRIPDPAEARAAVSEIRLLSEAELRRLFPTARIHRERVLGLKKSLVAYGGW
ncbi:MAG: methyltransferase domain-containing protein, partial [Solirubrobacterales bacterium]